MLAIIFGKAKELRFSGNGQKSPKKFKNSQVSLE